MMDEWGLLKVNLLVCVRTINLVSIRTTFIWIIKNTYYLFVICVI